MTESEFERGVHAEIARLARDLHGSGGDCVDAEDLLLQVTESAVRMLPDVKHSGVTLVDRRTGSLRSTAATGPIPSTLDVLQEERRQGPCLEAIWDHHTVRVDDYEAEERWPEFVTAVVARTAVRSSLSIQLYTHESELGALNLYSETPNAFTAHIEELALALAAHAAIGLSVVRRSEQFHTALASRDIIGQAKGIIMQRYDVNAVAAFSLLIKLSQHRNTPVHEIARLIVHQKHLPE